MQYVHGHEQIPKWTSDIAKTLKSGIGTKGKQKSTDYMKTLEAITPLVDEAEFEYNNDHKSYLTACKIFLDLWEYLADLAPYLPYHERKLCFYIITCIMKRREFDPAKLELQQKSQSGFVQKLSSIGLPNAKEIAQAYKNMALKTEQQALSHLSSMTSYAEIPSFYPSVLAINCFRIGDFQLTQDIVASMCTQKPSDKTLELIRQYTTLLSNGGDDNSSVKNTERDVVSRLFRHQNYLSGVKSKIEEEIVQQIRNSLPVLTKISSLKPAFFLVYLGEFVSEVADLLLSCNDIEWKYVPGYSQLVSSFVELHIETANIIDYTNEWLTTSLIMLHNDELLNVLIESALRKTRVFDVEAVLALLNVMDSWFIQVKELHDKLPHNFDYDRFETIIDTLFLTEHFQIISRTLILLYNMLDTIHGNHRIQFLSEFFFKKYFFNMFLHWNNDVRMCYQRILVYKVQRLKRKVARIDPLPSRVSSDLIRANSMDAMRGGGSESSGQQRGRSLDLPRTSLSKSAHQNVSQTKQILDPKNVNSTYLYKLIYMSSQKKIGMNSTAAGVANGLSKAEEAVDLVLTSKMDIYLGVLSDEQNDNNAEHQDVEPHLICPDEYKIYIPSSMHEFNDLKKEYKTWKKNAENSTGEIIYPILQFPKFRMSETD